MGSSQFHGIFCRKGCGARWIFSFFNWAATSELARPQIDFALHRNFHFPCFRERERRIFALHQNFRRPRVFVNGCGVRWILFSGKEKYCPWRECTLRYSTEMEIGADAAERKKTRTPHPLTPSSWKRRDQGQLDKQCEYRGCQSPHHPAWQKYRPRSLPRAHRSRPPPPAVHAAGHRHAGGRR